MVLTVLRLLDDLKTVEVTVFFRSGKRKSHHLLSEYSPEIQALLGGNFALTANGYGLRRPITREQYEKLINE